MNLDESKSVPTWLDVSRETVLELREFLAFVEKWNGAINLVSRGSLLGGWARHVLDSAQLLRLAPLEARFWVDFGSGGGFPGAVVAIVAKEKRSELRMTLLESDRRKAAFLDQVRIKFALPVQVVCDRVERVAPLNADVVSARAFAPLRLLFESVHRHVNPTGVAILPKGTRANEELLEARQTWNFEHVKLNSLVAPNASILMVRDLVYV